VTTRPPCIPSALRRSANLRIGAAELRRASTAELTSCRSNQRIETFNIVGLGNVPSYDRTEALLNTFAWCRTMTVPPRRIAYVAAGASGWWIAAVERDRRRQLGDWIRPRAASQLRAAGPVGGADESAGVLESWECLQSVLCPARQNHLFVDNLQAREGHYYVSRAKAEETTYRQNGIGRLATRGYDQIINGVTVSLASLTTVAPTTFEVR
jgi:hypothetical protein